MINIDEIDIYRSAQALLDKHKGNRDLAFAELLNKFIEYTDNENDDMLFLTLDIGHALKEITTHEYTGGTIH